jgi:anti-sigma B factor antagonist
MLKIEKIVDSNVLILRLVGDVDASNSVELDEAIQEFVTLNKQNLLVDASELDYISSAGLGVFMSYLEEFTERNIQFVIYGLSEKVHHVFKILGLDLLMKIKKNKAEAVQEIL